MHSTRRPRRLYHSQPSRQRPPHHAGRLRGQEPGRQNRIGSRGDSPLYVVTELPLKTDAGCRNHFTTKSPVSVEPVNQTVRRARRPNRHCRMSRGARSPTSAELKLVPPAAGQPDRPAYGSQRPVAAA